MADLEVRRFDLGDDGQQLNVTVETHNTSDRTLFFYRDVRGVQYDDASKTLRLLLTDRHRLVTEGAIQIASLRPPLRAIDPGESETISLRLPRLVTQLGPEQPGKPGPTLKELPVHEAVSVEAEISWSDKPFYPEPKSKLSVREQLRRWERGVLKARMDRGGPVAPPKETPPKHPRRRK